MTKAPKKYRFEYLRDGEWLPTNDRFADLDVALHWFRKGGWLMPHRLVAIKNGKVIAN